MGYNLLLLELDPESERICIINNVLTVLIDFEHAMT